MSLSPEQVDIIKATVPIVKEHGNTITTVFYKNLLTDVPELNNIFNTANQLNGHQATALANALYAYAANIDNLGALGPFVERVCMKHASLYIRRDQYEIVGTYLLAAMKQVLGSALTREIHEAWSAAYNQLADLMANKEEELLSTSNDWTDWRDFRIVRKIPESDEITSFHLSPVDGKTLPSFRPGQYISVQMDVPALKYLQSRQYSLSDRPKPDHYRISVKKEKGVNPSDPTAVVHPGHISNILHDVKKEGDIIQVSHPRGDFYLTDEKATTPIVLISAGVGITPMMSILNTLLATPNSSSSSSSSSSFSSPSFSASSSSSSLLSTANSNSNSDSTATTNSTRRSIHHIHTTRTLSLHPFLPHLHSLTTVNPNYRLTIFNKNAASSSSSTESLPIDTISTKTKNSSTNKSRIHQLPHRLALSKLPSPKSDLHLDNPKTEYYICGPEGFMRDVKGELMRMIQEENLASGGGGGAAVDESRIKLELFGTGGPGS